MSKKENIEREDFRPTFDLLLIVFTSQCVMYYDSPAQWPFFLSFFLFFPKQKRKRPRGKTIEVSRQAGRTGQDKHTRSSSRLWWTNWPPPSTKITAENCQLPIAAAVAAAATDEIDRSKSSDCLTVLLVQYLGRQKKKLKQWCFGAIFKQGQKWANQDLSVLCGQIWFDFGIIKSGRKKRAFESWKVAGIELHN